MFYDEIMKEVSNQAMDMATKYGFGETAEAVVKDLWNVSSIMLIDRTTKMQIDHEDFFVNSEDIMQDGTKIKFPFDNFFIEIIDQNMMDIGSKMQLGYLIRHQINDTYMFVLFRKIEDQPLDMWSSMVILSKLPRFFPQCTLTPEITKKRMEETEQKIADGKLDTRFRIDLESCCSGKIIPNLLNPSYKKQFCQRTTRTATCMISKLIMLNIGSIFDILQDINQRPEVIARVATRKNYPRDYKEPIADKVIDLRRPHYVYEKRESTGIVGSAKSAHNRRGHYRHYTTGKTIWIQDLTVKGNKPTVYKM